MPQPSLCDCLEHSVGKQSKHASAVGTRIMWRLRTRTCCQTARRCPPCYPWCSPLRVVCGGLVVLCRFSCVAVPVAVYMPSAALVSLRVSRLGHLFSPTKNGAPQNTHREATSSSRILPRSMPLLRRSDRAGSARRPPPAPAARGSPATTALGATTAAAAAALLLSKCPASQSVPLPGMSPACRSHQTQPGWAPPAG